MTGQFYRDEMKAIFQDKGALLILLGAVIIYPIIYSFAYQPEIVRQISTIVVDMDHSAASRQLIRMVDETEQIQVVSYAHSMDEARRTFFDKKETGGILAIPSGFEKQLLNGRQTDVSVYADGSFFLIYRQALSGAVSSVGTFAAGVEIKKLMAGGQSYDQALESRDPLSADLHFWFNPFSGYGSFIMPGLILIILQQTLLIGIGMIGGTGKEVNRHSYLVPVALRRGGVLPILFGKTFSYLTIYLFNTILTMVWVYHWFGYPNRAGFLHVLMLTVPFLLAVIFLGITISVLFRRRESSILFMVFLSPIVLFISGVSWPVSSIPGFVYQLGHVFPTTVMVPAYLRLRVMGAGLESVQHEYLLLLLQCGVYFTTAAAAIYLEARHNQKQETNDQTEFTA